MIFIVVGYCIRRIFRLLNWNFVRAQVNEVETNLPVRTRDGLRVEQSGRGVSITLSLGIRIFIDDAKVSVQLSRAYRGNVNGKAILQAVVFLPISIKVEVDFTQRLFVFVSHFHHWVFEAD